LPFSACTVATHLLDVMRSACLAVLCALVASCQGLVVCSPTIARPVIAARAALVMEGGVPKKGTCKWFNGAFVRLNS
jgi:hypothetical protein